MAGPVNKTEYKIMSKIDNLSIEALKTKLNFLQFFDDFQNLIGIWAGCHEFESDDPKKASFKNLLNFNSNYTPDIHVDIYAAVINTCGNCMSSHEQKMYQEAYSEIIMSTYDDSSDDEYKNTASRPPVRIVPAEHQEEDNFSGSTCDCDSADNSSASSGSSSDTDKPSGNLSSTSVIISMYRLFKSDTGTTAIETHKIKRHEKND